MDLIKFKFRFSYLCKKLFIVFFLQILFFARILSASPDYLTLQSRIIQPDGHNLEAASVNYRFSITDPVGTCVVYQEDFSNVNMVDSKGLVAIKIGSGTRGFPVAPTTMKDIFTNFNSPVFNCQAGGTYTAASSDQRKIVMQFNDGSGWQTVPSLEINSTPFSLESLSAQKLGLFPAGDYVRSAQFATCVGGEAVHFNGTNFTCVSLGGAASSVAAAAGLAGTPSISFSGDTNTGLYSGAADTISISNNGSNTFNITSTALSSTTTGGATITQTNGTAAAPTFSFAGDADTGWYRAAADTLAASTAGAERIRIDSSGNVGIGTTSPGAKLEVGTDGLFRVLGGSYGSIQYPTSGQGLELGYIPGYDYLGNVSAVGSGGITAYNRSTSVYQGMRIHSNGLTVGARNGSASMVFDPSGSVGIGTSSPSNKLTITDGVTTAVNTGTGANPLFAVEAQGPALMMTRDNGSGIEMFYGNSVGGYGIIGTSSAHHLRLRTSNTDRMTIDTSGNVGIGATTPTEKLEVSGAIRLGTTAGANPGTIRWDGTNFSGYNGTSWAHFVPTPPASGACDTTTTYTAAGTYSYTVPASFGTITIKLWGGGGSGGGAGAFNGTSGGSSSITSLGLVAGGGGLGPSSAMGTFGNGGVASGGSINTNGANGTAPGAGFSGTGGSANLGGAGGAGRNTAGSGPNGAAPGGGGAGGTNTGGPTYGGGGGAGAYVEKVFTSVDIAPGSTLSDVVVGAGGVPSATTYMGGNGGTGQISITCSATGAPIANDRSLLFINSGAYSTDVNFVYSVTGDVGIGTASPQTKLQVEGIISPATNNTYTLGNASYRFTEVYATNGVINTSDRREKKDIYNTDLGLDFINKLRPVSYRWNTGVDKDVHYGLIAQEAEQALVESGKMETTSIVTHDEVTDRYGVRYSELISPLIKAFQELYDRFVTVDSEVATLKAKDAIKDREIASLKAENSQLKTNDEAKAKEIEILKQENAAIKAYLCLKDEKASICK